MYFTRQAVQEVDRRAVEEFGIPVLVLMENAGRAVAGEALRMLKHGGGNAGVLVVAGVGNNGGDGLVAARHLHNAGVKVEILLMGGAEKYKDAAGVQLKIVEAMKLPVQVISSDHAEVRDWVVESDPRDLVVDAIFGTGLSRPVEGLARDVIVAVNGAKRAVLAVDIPSGLDCDTGEALGVAIRATETVTFCGPKVGFKKAGVGAYVGKWVVGDIGAPRELLEGLGRA